MSFQGEVVSFNKLLSVTYDDITMDGIEMNCDNCIVLSMIGRVKTGKSTFINSFISYLVGNDVCISKITGTNKHWMMGIDYIVCSFVYKGKKMHILVLECQGLMYNDSINDEKLWMLIYLVSNIIVIHESDGVFNKKRDGLRTLFLIAYKMKNVQITKKPILYFREKDSYITCDPNAMFFIIFRNSNGKYDRGSDPINKLFSDIRGIVTYPLSKKKIHLLNQNKYLSINEGFVDAFERLLRDIHTLYDKDAKPCNVIFETLKYIINNVNNTKSFHNYNYYTLLIDQQFDDFWMNHVPSDLYDTIEATPYESCYQLCKTKLDNIKEIIQIFKKSFQHVGEILLNDQIRKFYNKLQKPLLITQNYCYLTALKIMNTGNNDINTLLSYIHNELYNVNIFNDKTIYISKNTIYNKWSNITNNTLCSLALTHVIDYIYLTYEKHIYPSYIQTHIDLLNKTYNINRECKNKTLNALCNLKTYIHNITDFTVTREQHYSDIRKNIENDVMQYFEQKFEYIMYVIDEPYDFKQLINDISWNIIDFDEISYTDIYNDDYFNNYATTEIIKYHDLDESRKYYVDSVFTSKLKLKTNRRLESFFEIHNTEIDEYYKEHFIAQHHNKVIKYMVIQQHKHYDFYHIVIEEISDKSVKDILNSINSYLDVQCGKYEIPDKNYILGYYLFDDYNKITNYMKQCSGISDDKFKKHCIIGDGKRCEIRGVFGKIIIDCITTDYLRK